MQFTQGIPYKLHIFGSVNNDAKESDFTNNIRTEHSCLQWEHSLSFDSVIQEIKQTALAKFNSKDSIPHSIIHRFYIKVALRKKSQHCWAL